MKTTSILLISAVAAIGGEAPPVLAEVAPEIVWEAATPSGLANSIQGVGWSPVGSGQVVFGSTDRWVRTRQTENGALIYSVLQPHRSGSANQAIYSADGTFIAVHNSSDGLGYRVHRSADGVFLGLLTVSIDAQGLVHFTPDTQLLGNVGGDGTLSAWRVEEFTVVLTVGSGYDRTNTTFNFSPNGALQSAASQGSIIVRRRSDGVAMRILAGGSVQSFTPVAFTPDSTRLASGRASSSEITLWRISDGAALMAFQGSKIEGVSAIRFTPDGTRLVTTGYLPFVDSAGLSQQKGLIRFWRVADGVLRQVYDAHTGLAVTSPVAWSPDGTQFAYGTYEGTALVARTPSEGNGGVAQAQPLRVEVLPNGNVLLRQSGSPGASYHVETATNFSTWRELGVTRANSNGDYEFLDTNGHGFPRKFYRSWIER